MSFVAPRRPMDVATMNQKAEVRQKPLAVRSVGLDRAVFDVNVQHSTDIRFSCHSREGGNPVS
jgi:hypothetical protein